MSRCGSCDLYWPSEDKDNFGVTCRGDCGVEECADKLQDLVFNLRVELARKWICRGTERTGRRERKTVQIKGKTQRC